MWSSIIGHRRQIDQLRRALLADRLPNAYLFAGPRGIGKRRVADALAAALLCARPEDAAACGSCPGCRKALAGSHPDLFVVAPEAQQLARGADGADDPGPSKRKKPSEEIKVDQVRDLQARLQFYPLEAKAKIAIIDEADRMNEAAANSLLKILEEPPADTHFVLIATTPQALLPTIRSRSSRLDFGPLENEALIGELTRDGRMTRPEATRIAQLAGGSLGMAFALDPAAVAQTIGRFAALSRGASSADIIAAAEAWSKGDPAEMRLTFDLLASFYRDILRLVATGAEGGLIHPEAREAARGMTPARADRALAEIAAARRTLDTAANKQLMFEHLLFSLAS